MPGFNAIGSIEEEIDELQEVVLDALSLSRNHRTLEARVARLEGQMTDINAAETDLANVVQAVVNNTNTLNTQVASLQQAIANGNAAAVQQAADAIEAQVATLKGTLPAPAPTPGPVNPPAGP